MTRVREALIPLADGPPLFDERQVTPGQLLDMRLGYLSNLGADVELVTTTTERVVPITIAAVGRSFLLGERPDGSRVLTQDEMDRDRMWKDCDYVTFYTTEEEGGVTTYGYEHLSYVDLGLAPVRDQSYRPMGWHPEPIWHLRWPAEAGINQNVESLGN